MTSFREHAPDVLWCVLLSILTFSAFTLGYWIHFHGGLTYEFCHYAEIASNLLNGHGYTTRTFYPSELAFLEQSGINAAATATAPVAFRFPLFAFWSAFWMMLAGQTDLAMVLSNAMAHLAWVLSLFLIGQRLFNRRVAVAASLLWAVQPTMTAGFDISGHPDVLFGWLFLLHSYGLWWLLTNVPLTNAPTSSDLWRFFAIGIVGGLCFLTRQNFALWLPLFMLLAWGTLPARKTQLLGSYLGGLLIVSLGWFVYYVAHFHRLTNPLIFSELAESTLIFQMPWLEYRVFSWTSLLQPGFLSALLTKFFVYGARYVGDLFTVWLQPVFFPLFLASLILKTTPRLTFLRFSALLLVWQLVLFSFLRHESMGLLTGRYFLWLAPIALLGALAFVERWAATPRNKTALLAVVCLGPLIYWFLAFQHLPSRRSSHPSGLDLDRWEEIVYLKQHTDPRSWIASNIPTQITWYAKRTTVNIPNTLDDFRRLIERYPIEHVFFSNQPPGEPENYPHWEHLPLKSFGFDPEKSFAGGILYSRHTPRMKNEETTP